jgi:hypothetical protein
MSPLVLGKRGVLAPAKPLDELVGDRLKRVGARFGILLF